MADSRDDEGGTPYDWLVRAVPAGASTVVDLACGSGPVAAMLPAARVVGVDRSAGELARARTEGGGGRLVRAEATALPLAGAWADAVVASMALMLLAPLEAVLAEVARVLRPGGTLVATVPVRAANPGPAGTPAFADILGALGQVGADYPEPLLGPGVAPRFAAAGLTLVDDDTGLFSRTVRGPEDAGLVVRSFYAPGAGAERVAAAVEELQRRVRSAPVELSYRIRRLVAHR
jgi:SAM-dependent methyltransferase